MPRVRAAFSIGLFLLLAVFAPKRAAGAEPHAERRVKQHAHLRYERGPGTEQCSEASALRRAVEGHLGYDPFDDAAGLQIRCQIVVQRGRLIAVVNVSNRASGRSGERKLVSANMNCTELADAVALAIAIAIDPLLPAAIAPLGSTEPLRDEAAREPAPSDESAPPPPKPIFSMGGGASLSYALQPSAALGATLAFAARRGPLSLALEAQWRPPSHVTYLSGTVRAQLFSAAMLGCGHYGAWNACIVAEAGVMAGSAEGYLRSARDTTSFVATGARIAWQPSVFPNWSALVYVAGLVPLVRTTLWVDPQSVWTMPHLAAQAGILGFFEFR